MKDRGIKKWAPFKSLEGQFEMIDKLVKEKQKVSRPIIDEDRKMKMDSILQSIEIGQELRVEYYDDGFVKTDFLHILKIDNVSKVIYFEEKQIFVENILDLD